MTTKLTFTVSFDRLLNDLSVEDLINLKKAVDSKLQSLKEITKPTEEIHITEVFSMRTCNILHSLEVSHLSDLRKYSQEYLRRVRGVGNKVLKEIQITRIKYNV